MHSILLDKCLVRLVDHMEPDFFFFQIPQSSGLLFAFIWGLLPPLISVSPYFFYHTCPVDLFLPSFSLMHELGFTTLFRLKALL